MEEKENNIKIENYNFWKNVISRLSIYEVQFLFYQTRKRTLQQSFEDYMDLKKFE